MPPRSFTTLSRHHSCKADKLLAPFVLSMLPFSFSHAEPTLIAIGQIDGGYEDFAVETKAPLENGVPGNKLGGIGSGLAYAGANTFLALPDRGPNATPYNSAVDDTTSTSRASTRCI